MSLHPHNAVLQWWLELGIVGAACGAALTALAFIRSGELGRGKPGRRAAGMAALAMAASAVAVALVGYGIWQAWWMATLWLAAAFMATLGGVRSANGAASETRPG